MTMASTPRTITFDCAEPARLAAFWSEVVGREVDVRPDVPSAPDVASIGLWQEESTGQLGLLFLRVPEGKTTKNRMHLDLGCEDRAAEVARLVALGATHVADHADFGIGWSVLTDPEGNEFCLADPHP